MLWIALFLMQDASSQAERVRAAMSASLEHQRESVQKQETAIRATPAGIRAVASSAAIVWPAPITAACDPVPPPELSQMIGETARKVGIDGGLVREVARQESGFRPCAVSPKGAQGLMQLMPATQTQFAVSDPFDAKQSLEAGSKLLKQLLDRYNGDLTLALSAYNAGSGCVDRSGGIPDIPETKNYVASILSHAAGFESPELQSFTDSLPLAPALALRLDQASGGSGCQPTAGR
jgi:soluble lytic murein transglycosylase-like protein